MILLEPGNRILAETVSAQIKPEISVDDEKPQRGPTSVQLCDFDDVSYQVVIEPSALSVMKVSLNLPCYHQIKEKGAEEAAKKHYESLLADSPDNGFDLTLKIDLDNKTIADDVLISKIQMFKPNVLGGVFDYYFSALLEGKPRSESFQFDLRKDTKVFFFPRADRVTVVFGLEFEDKVDTAIAKVFMQEFVAAKKRIGQAPPCTFGVNPPLELKEFGITEPTGNLGFISFAVMKNHLDGGKKDKVVGVMQTFRSYVQYHLKCSKSYFHSRMRARVLMLLKILNRAKIEPEKKEMKTIGGKTFIRSA